MWPGGGNWWTSDHQQQRGNVPQWRMNGWPPRMHQQQPTNRRPNFPPANFQPPNFVGQQFPPIPRMPFNAAEFGFNPQNGYRPPRFRGQQTPPRPPVVKHAVVSPLTTAAAANPPLPGQPSKPSALMPNQPPPPPPPPPPPTSKAPNASPNSSSTSAPPRFFLPPTPADLLSAAATQPNPPLPEPTQAPVSKPPQPGQQRPADGSSGVVVRSSPGAAAARGVFQGGRGGRGRGGATPNFGNRRPGDWDCSRCNKQNFAYRQVCLQCQLPKQQQQNVWKCPRCQFFNAKDLTVCKECHLKCQTGQFAPHNRPPFAPLSSSSQRDKPPPPPTTQTEPTPTTSSSEPKGEQPSSSDQEEQFNVMFGHWESQFERWKEENKNNPDQAYVETHIRNMNTLRAKMLERRNNLKRQRNQTLPPPPPPPPSSHVESDADVAEIPSATTKEQDVVSAEVPALGDGRDKWLEEEEEEDEARAELTPEDLANISKAVRSLGQGKTASAATDEPPPAKASKTDPPPTPPPPAKQSGANGSRFGSGGGGGGDWDCSRCQMQNFAFRTACKFCQLGKGESDVGGGAGDDGPAWYPSIKMSGDAPQAPEWTSYRRFDDDEDAQLFSRRDYRSIAPPYQPPPDPSSGWTTTVYDYSTTKVVDYGHNSSQPTGRYAVPTAVDAGKRNEEAPFAANHLYNYNASGRRRRSRSPSPLPQPLSTEPSKPQPSPQGDRISIDDIIQPPGRYTRPPKLVLIFRGLPGSGKSMVAKEVKILESRLGTEAPRILALDDYFECDGSYEYEEELEDSYRSSLIRSFKKQVDDGYFSFIMVDCINDKTNHYQQMWSYAKQKGFEVYVGEVEADVAVCASRNVHKRTSDEIENIKRGWEATPSYFNKVDFSGLLQEKAIEQVEMEDADKEEEDDDGDEVQIINEDDEDEDDRESSSQGVSAPFQLSKWEVMDKEDKMAQLDGVSQKAIKKLAERHSSINDWLEIAPGDDDEERGSDGKKRVRWADVEERKKQMKMRDIGFVVGQTNWNRLMDPTEGGSALTKTKIIPNRFQ